MHVTVLTVSTMLTCGFSRPGDSVGSGYAGEPSESESGPDDKDGQVQESQISLQSAPGQLHVTVYILVCTEWRP